MTRKQAQAIRAVIGLLVEGEYEALANMTRNRHFDSDMLRTAVDSYGRVLVLPPNGLPPDIGEVQSAVDPNKTHFVMSLWTSEEGQSDLSLEMTLIESRPGLTDVEIDNIHVL